MSKPNQLYLLADHIKLSLLERQRAQSLQLDNDGNDDGNNPQDGHISRSLDQLRDGVASLEQEKAQFEEQGDTAYVSSPPLVFDLL
jgi:syntaxin 8